MRTPRFLHYLILLLAVWLPLDNAVAGAVIADCPMMSHAFEKGMQVTIDPVALHPTMAQAAPLNPQMHADLCGQSVNCGTQCGVCLLLGGAALPSLPTGMTFATGPTDFQAATQTQAPAGVHTHPFRPPIA